jgi:hypothetical protein
MLGVKGYIHPREVEEIRQGLANALFQDCEKIANELKLSLDNYGIADSGEKFSSRGVLSIGEAVRRATIVLWRTDLWRSAVSGYRLFENESLSDDLLTSPVELHLPSATQLHGNSGDILPANAALQAVLISKVSDNAQLAEPHSIFVCPFFIPFVPVMSEPDTSAEDWTYIRPFVIAPDQRFGSAAYVHALLAFMRTKYVSQQQYTFDRAERRRAQKEKRRLPSIRVIYLRQKAAGGDEPHEKHIDWQYQWRVRGHWGQQWYPSIQQHKPTYVGEYLKGPEDKPLKPLNDKQTIYVVSR